MKKIFSLILLTVICFNSVAIGSRRADRVDRRQDEGLIGADKREDRKEDRAYRRDNLPTTMIMLGETPYSMSIVKDENTLSKWLRDTDTLPANDGIMLKFDSNQVISAIIEIGSVPLTIAVTNAAGNILDIVDIDSQGRGIVQTKDFIRYVICINKGGLEKANLKIGDTITNLS